MGPGINKISNQTMAECEKQKSSLPIRIRNNGDWILERIHDQLLNRDAGQVSLLPHIAIPIPMQAIPLDLFRWPMTPFRIPLFPEEPHADAHQAQEHQGGDDGPGDHPDM
jgi:hypothetical protein